MSNRKSTSLLESHDLSSNEDRRRNGRLWVLTICESSKLATLTYGVDKDQWACIGFARSASDCLTFLESENESSGSLGIVYYGHVAVKSLIRYVSESISRH